MALLQECPQCKEKLSLKSKTEVKEGEEFRNPKRKERVPSLWIQTPKSLWEGILD